MYELRGNEILDRFYEADDVPVASGGTPGTSSKTYTIPDGQIWYILQLGGSASIDQTELELEYSGDGGSTWTNPFDSEANKLRCIHLQNGLIGQITFTNPLKFVGSGTNIQLKFLFKNYNEANTAELVGWFNGWRE